MSEDPTRYRSGPDLVIKTPRLLLRLFVLGDAPTVARLAGRREIADTTISVPHPYSEEQAHEWIAAHTDDSRASQEVALAICLKEGDQLIGAVGLRHIETEHGQAEMGLWLGVDYWHQGYATEATRAMLRFGFEQLRLNRIYARYMVRNPASGRALEKVGMKREGVLRQGVRKWGAFEDVVLMAILREDWRTSNEE